MAGVLQVIWVNVAAGALLVHGVLLVPRMTMQPAVNPAPVIVRVTPGAVLTLTEGDTLVTEGTISIVEASLPPLRAVIPLQSTRIA